jgi:GGDEF domain-containing protein
MTTLSPFLWSRGGVDDTAGEKQAEALNRIVSVLLQRIALHSFNFDPDQFSSFDRAIRGIPAEFEHAPDEASAVLAAGAAIRLLEEHSRAAERHDHAFRQELQSVVALLSGTLLEVTGVSPEMTERVKERVKEMERSIAPGGRTETIAAARISLASCLSEIRAEFLAAQEFRQSPSWPDPETDQITGLPNSTWGARAINSVWNRRHQYYVAVFALQRLETINLRFGFQAGDQMLLLMSQHFARQLTPGDRLFRWRGPCLAMLMQRAVPEAMVNAELNRIAGTRLETAITVRDREVIAPLSVSWSLFSLNTLGSAEDLIRGMNHAAGSPCKTGGQVLAAAT